MEYYYILFYSISEIMENKRPNLKKTPSAGYGSNAHLKVAGSHTLSAVTS